ncbi:MAG: YciI family protein [Planctomycetota bacterium]
MDKFLFIYLEPAEKKGPEPTPQQMQAVMKQWWDWLGQGQAAGWVVEMGDALQPETRTVHADLTITDGLHPEAKELVGGYTIVQAETIDAAAELAKGCPIYESGGTVQVRPLAKVEIPTE